MVPLINHVLDVSILDKNARRSVVHAVVHNPEIYQLPKPDVFNPNILSIYILDGVTVTRVYGDTT